MTTSISNTEAVTRAQQGAAAEETEKRVVPGLARRDEPVRTVASRFIILTLLMALVLSTLAYGAVYYWTLAIFQAGAALTLFFWAVDAWRSRRLRVSRNLLQLPLMALFILGLVQLLPFGESVSEVAPGLSGTTTLSLDPYSTRLVLVQLAALLVYFSAALAFIDSPRRLRIVSYTIIIFGFVLAVFGLIQSFTSPTKVYWIKELSQSTSFGPFINRHHFAAYMEMTLGLPLGLLLAGAVERNKMVLYIFAAALMGIALIMTNSRGGIISLFAEIGFLLIVVGLRRRPAEGEGRRATGRPRALLLRAGLALAIMLALFTGVVFLGGESILSRFIGTVSAEDPTTGRTHFWAGALQIVREHPVLGSGLGSFGVAYTRYDTRNGLMRLEQAHNDYLQVLSDAGLLGGVLGLVFIVALFRSAVARAETEDTFRRGIATGALAGCFAVLVHSFFDFTLHTTANALLFLTLAALATLDGRVEQVSDRRRSNRRRRRHRSSSQRSEPAAAAPSS